MDVHKNAPLTPAGREIMVSRVIAGQPPRAVAAAFGVCVKTVNKWVKRFRAEGAAALRPVLETLSDAEPGATTAAIQQLRSALKDLGSPCRLRRLPAAGEAVQVGRLRAIARRLNQSRCVPGMTVHQAKGKEWHAVGARLKQGQIERLANGLSEGVADDRLLYVALTRARETVRLV